MRQPGRARIGGLCAAAALGAFAGTSQAVAAPGSITVTSPGGLGPVEASWDISRGQFVPDLPDSADAALRRVFGNRFAGLHYWRAEGRKPVLALHLVDGSTGDIAAVRRLLDSGPLSTVRTPVRIVPATASARQLDRGVRALSGRLSAQGLMGVGVDTVRNQLVVETAPSAGAASAGRTAAGPSPSRAQRRLVRRLGLPATAIRWKRGAPMRTTGLTTEMTGIYGGTRIWIPIPGSNALYGCTAGFGGISQFGRFMTTAGHCGRAGLPVYRSVPPTDAVGVQISSMRTSAYNLDSGDIGIYLAGFASARQYGGGDTVRYVQAASSPRVGEWVCFYGASSRALSCGSVSIINRSYVPAGFNGAKIGHQFCTANQGPSAPGDSGSAVWIPRFQDDDRKISLRGTLSAGGAGTICATDVAVTLQQSAALPATEEPPCSL